MSEPMIEIPLAVAKAFKTTMGTGWRTPKQLSASVLALEEAIDAALPYEFNLGDVVRQPNGALGSIGRPFSGGITVEEGRPTSNVTAYADPTVLRLVCRAEDRADR